jgi:hypothetical protein
MPGERASQPSAPRENPPPGDAPAGSWSGLQRDVTRIEAPNVAVRQLQQKRTAIIDTDRFTDDRAFPGLYAHGLATEVVATAEGLQGPCKPAPERGDVGGLECEQNARQKLAAIDELPPGHSE